MIKLFYYPRNASWVVHMLLVAIDKEHELVLVDRKQDAQKNDEYLALNPTGRIPTLIDGDQIIVESAAICLHLAEKYGAMEWLGASGDRSEVYQWLFYLTGTLQPALMGYIYPEKQTTLQDVENDIKQVFANRVGDALQLLDQQLAKQAFLAGEQVTLVDLFAFMLCHWASSLSTPPMRYKNIARFMTSMAQKHYVQTVAEKEGTELSVYC